MNILFYGILTVIISIAVLQIVRLNHFKDIGRIRPEEPMRFRWEKFLAFPFGLETICALKPSFFTPDAPIGDDSVYNDNEFGSWTRCYAHALAMPPGIGETLGAVAYKKATHEERIKLGINLMGDQLPSPGMVKHAKLRLKAEGLIKVNPFNLFTNKRRRGVVLFVFDVKSNLYHFYKLNQNGWSSKPGTTPVTRFDARGKKIRNPRMSILDHNYVTVGAYFVYYDKSIMREAEAMRRTIEVEELAIV